jgi:hypothetical protein
MNHVSPSLTEIEPGVFRYPILAKDTECRQRDGELFNERLREAQAQDDRDVITKIGNCLCKSSWCKKCHKLYYIPKYKDYIQTFDFRKTRHVILTTDRGKFIDCLDALRTITEKKSLSAFIRKLRNGKKTKVGGQWVWLYEPIKIKQALAVLEFYEDGFPHWHLLIEVSGSGKNGMIGGANLHRAWKHGIVKETYFRDAKHWKNIAGYFADTGYFEKGKEYQTELPEEIKEHYERRIRRITYYPGKKDGVYEEERPDISEAEAFEEVSKFFDGKKKEQQANDKEKRKINYKVILGQCGTKTYLKTVLHGYLIQMILPVPFKTMKEILNPIYEDGRGYVCKMNRAAIQLIENNSVNVIRSRCDQKKLFEEEEESDGKAEAEGGGDREQK